MVIEKRFFLFFILLGLLFFVAIYQNNFSFYNTVISSKESCWSRYRYDYSKGKFSGGSAISCFKGNLTFDNMIVENDTCINTYENNSYSLSKPNSIRLENNEFKIVSFSRDTIVLISKSMPYDNMYYDNDIPKFKNLNSQVWNHTYLIRTHRPTKFNFDNWGKDLSL